MKINYDGRVVEAVKVEHAYIVVAPNTYSLPDGTTINLNTFLVDVLRLEGEKDAFGNQAYWCTWQVAVSTYQSK